jgi:hypothetical protein
VILNIPRGTALTLHPLLLISEQGPNIVGEFARLVKGWYAILGQLESPLDMVGNGNRAIQRERGYYLNRGTGAQHYRKRTCEACSQNWPYPRAATYKKYARMLNIGQRIAC